MSQGKGMIVLMGSGELTATMVEVHKEILLKIGNIPNAVFLDAPAGFQLNVDELSQRAVEYFRTRVRHPMSVVSFKSRDIQPVEAEKAFHSLKKADYILIGPGSPTYAVRQLKETSFPEIIEQRIRNGGCLVAASAAALTVGRFTLPVYEIYKVGEPLHWTEGLNILEHFGLDYVVIPHWNNAEGGTHDTRCCFMGESRFNTLASSLPERTGIIGLDEHTACILDFETETAAVRGIGRVVIRHGGTEKVFRKGMSFPLDMLRGHETEKTAEIYEHPVEQEESKDTGGGFWDTIHSMEDAFNKGLAGSPEDAVNAVLELDSVIWKAQHELENTEFIIQARDLFREMIVLLGTHLAPSPGSREDCLSPLVEPLLELREHFRKKRMWKEADALRDCLGKAGITVEDTADGSGWRVRS